MKAYVIDYEYNGRRYRGQADATTKEAARNQIARKRHGLKAADAKALKIKNVSVVGYF